LRSSKHRFLRAFSRSFQSPRRRSCHFVCEGLIEIQRLEIQRFFREQCIFHICTLYNVQIAKITYITRRCLRSAESQAESAHSCLKAKVHLYRGDSVAPRSSVRLSVTCLRTIYSKSECRSYFKFFGDIMQYTSNWDSHRFNE